MDCMINAVYEEIQAINSRLENLNADFFKAIFKDSFKSGILEMEVVN